MTSISTKITFTTLITTAVLASFLIIPNASQAMGHEELKSKRGMSTSASSTKPTITKDLSCVQEAVLDRETAIATAWTAFNTDMVSAFTKRTESLVAAWKNTDVAARSSDLNDLWKTWKTDSKKAHTTLRTERKEAWTDYKKTMKDECRTTRLPKEDAEPKEASGTVTL